MSGENRLLIIGIDEYNDRRYKKINNAKRDTDRFRKVLEERYGFKLVQPAIYDAEATREKIIDALYDLAVSSYEEDNIIIYYAGHGDQNPTSGKGYWIPVDGENKASNYIFNSTVLDIIEGINAKHILLISDSCFSGTFLTKTRSSGRILTHEELDQLQSRWLFVSGGEEKVSDGEPGKGSPFAMSLCEFLEKNESLTASAGELFDTVIRLTELRCNQQPQAAPIKFDAHKGGEMIFKLVTLPNEESKEVEKIIFPLPESPSLDYYIPRTVTYYEHQKSEASFFFEPERGSSYLKDLIHTHKRVVLLGTAGSGKSVELQQLFKTLSDSSSFVPIYKRFNTYTNEDLEKYLQKGWDQINPSSLVIILDGLDEVQPQFFHTALRKIIAFSENNPDLKIIISCRTNFYELPTENFSGTLEGFKVFTLNDISVIEIKKYAEAHFEIDTEQFITDVYDASFLDLIQKPYFLNILIKHYLDKGNFNAKRAGIMEQALLNYYSNNKEHFKSTISASNKHEMFSLLERIAFAMEIMGKNFITDNELLKILPNSDDFENCKYLPAFKHDTDKEQWMFEHNNIQEFLASRVLSRQPFNKLIEIITIGSGNEKKVKATWVNTLSFFISIGEPEQVNRLLDWISENDREIIIRFESDRISDERRIAVFKQIFNFYSDKQIWLSSNKFSDSDLARFGQYEEVLNFLLSKLETANTNRITKLNAVHVLDDFNLHGFPSYFTKIESSFIALLETPQLDYYDIFSTLSAMAKLNMTNKQILDYVVHKFKKRKNQYIRAGLYKLLHHSLFLDNYVDVLLDGIDLNRIEDGIEDRDSVNLMDESFHLKMALEKLKDPKALKTLMKFLSAEGKHYFYTTDYKEIIKALIDNGISVYRDNPSMFENILDFYVTIIKYYNRDMKSLILPFFENTNTKWDAFRIIWSDKKLSDYEKSEGGEFLLDADVIASFLEAFKKGEFLNEDIERLHNMLFWNRRNQLDVDKLLQQIETVAEQVGNLVLKRPEIKDWNQINKRRIQKSFDLLFHKNALIKEIELIYSQLQTEELNQTQLFAFRTLNTKNLEETFSSSALELLRDHTYGGRRVTLTYIRDWIEKSEEFSHYQIEQIFDYLCGSNNTYIDVSDLQKDFIYTWCATKGSDKRIIWFFIHRFQIKLPDQKLLDFTFYYDYNLQVELDKPGTIDQLEKFISKSQLKTQVKNNLEGSIYNSLVWSSNASYAIRNNIKDSYPSILNCLENYDEDDYKISEVLTLWFNKTEDCIRLRNLIQKAKSEDIMWKGISLLNNAKKEQPFLRDYLNKIMHNETLTLEKRFKAANHLMLMNDIAGLEFAANSILNHANPTFDFMLNLYNLPKLTDKEAVPQLMKLLFLSKQKEFQVERFNNLESIVINTLYNIGVQSDDNLLIIKEAIKKFIEVNERVLMNLNFLHFTIIKIEEQLNIQKSQSYSVEDAIKEWKILSEKE